jgi:histidine triad (HIT) family protein
MKDNCIICRIINRKVPSWIIYEDDNTICFLPKEVEVFGHTVIAPKSHYSDIYDIPEDDLYKLTVIAKKLAAHYKEQINATGVNLLHASGESAQQSVFHFHLHLLPRFKDDGIDAWPRLSKIVIDRDAILQQLYVKDFK